MGSVTKIGAGDIPKTAGWYITAAGRSRGLRYPRSPIWAAVTARTIGRCITAAGRSRGLRHPRSPIWEAGTARIIGRCFTKAGSWKVPRPCRSSIRDGVTARTTGTPISAGSSSGPGSRRTGCSAAVMRKTAGRYIIGGERWKAFRFRRSNIWAAVTARTPGRWSIRDAKCRAHRRRRLKSLGGVTPGDVPYSGPAVTGDLRYIWGFLCRKPFFCAVPCGDSGTVFVFAG